METNIKKKVWFKILKFRILFKLHKEKIGLRPTINFKFHPTSLISLLIDLIL